MSPEAFPDTVSAPPPSPATAAPANSSANTTVGWRPSEIFVLCLVVASYCIISLHILRIGLSLTNHDLTYPLDDTYITMAMAKNFALHGLWSTSSAPFVSTTSCPGFVLLLAAAFRLTGPSVWWPLALSFSFGLLAIVMAQRLLAGAGLTVQFLSLTALVLFTPLAVLALIGMEHTLHLLLVLALLHLVSRTLVLRKPPGTGVLLLTAAAVTVRYETLFLVAVAGLLYLLQRQIRDALMLGAAAATPVIVYGAISVWNGCYWLPHTIAMKGISGSAALHSPWALPLHFLSCLARAPHMIAVLGWTIAPLMSRNVRQNVRVRSLLLMVFGATMLHLALADVTWVYRYESYLIAASIAVVACSLPLLKIRRDWLAVTALLICGLAGFQMLSFRTVQAQGSLPYRSLAIFSQQVQMARFLGRYYQHSAVAANDIGAISYFANVDCLDLMGLGDKTVFWLAHQGVYSTRLISALATARHVKVAIVYDPWFTSGAVPVPSLPASWTRVERWTTPYGFYLGGDTVSFYATDPSEVDGLKQSLAGYASSLPPDVRIAKD